MSLRNPATNLRTSTMHKPNDFSNSEDIRSAIAMVLRTPGIPKGRCNSSRSPRTAQLLLWRVGNGFVYRKGSFR